MKETIYIELKELDAHFLREHSQMAPFLTPTGYFNQLEKEVTLQLLSANSGFNVPEDYFSQLENSIVRSSSLTTKETIAVPDDYFDGLESAIFEKIENEETPVRKISFKKAFQLWGSVAAAFVIGFFFFNTSTTESCLTFTCLMEQTDFSEDELLHVYDDEIANELIDDIDFLDDISLDDEEIFDYLIDENFDLEALDNTYEL